MADRSTIGDEMLLPVTLVSDVDTRDRCIVSVDCGTLRFEVPYEALLPREQEAAQSAE